MSRSAAVALVAFASVLAVTARAQDRPLLRTGAKQDSPVPSVEDWIARLGHAKYAERQAAFKALEQLGPAALESLKKAVASSDLETRRRAVDLIGKIQRKIDTDRVFTPHRVQLAYKNKPVLEAIEDLGRRAQFPIRIEGDRAALAQRTITLETGPLSFWDALDVLSRKAGLKEVPPLPEKKPQAAITGNSIVIMGGPGGMRVSDAMAPAKPLKPREIVLGDGQAPDTPTHVAGSIRVQALPPQTPVPGVSKEAGERLIALDVAAEPSLIWKDLVSVQVTRAIDERDRALPQRWVPYKQPAPPRSNTGILIINGQVINPADSASRANPHLAAVVLKGGDTPARSLKELSGIVTGLVLAAPEALVKIDDVLKSAGQVVKGERGGVVRVVDVQHKEGEVRLMVEVVAPQRSFEEEGPRLNGTIIINGQVLGGKEKTLSAANFTLLDKNGQPLQILRAVHTGRDAGAAQELELTYRQGQADALRLVYTDRPSYLLDVPFTLKNVPLQ